MANDKRDDAVNHAARMIIRTATQGNRTKIYQQLYDEAYDAGHAALAAARSEWKAIETDADYPPIGQRVMLASNRAGDRLIYESTVWSEETAQYAGKGWNDYVAWMPIPEFSKR